MAPSVLWRWEKHEEVGRAAPCAEPGAEIIGGAKNEQDVTCGPCALGAGAEQSAGKPCSCRSQPASCWHGHAAGGREHQGRSQPVAAHLWESWKAPCASVSIR